MKKPAFPQEVRDEAMRIYRATNSVTAASRATGVHRDTVYRWANGAGKARYQPEEIKSIHIPLSVLAEREHRLAVNPRDYTAAFFGDPLPGYSALDRR